MELLIWGLGMRGTKALLLAGATALLGLGPAIVIMAGTGWAAATAMHRWIPPHPRTEQPT